MNNSNGLNNGHKGGYCMGFVTDSSFQRAEWVINWVAAIETRQYAKK